MTATIPTPTTAGHPAPARRRLRSLVLNGLLTVAAFGLLGMAVWSNRDEIRGVFQRQINPWLLVAAFGIYLTGILLTFVRWFLLLRAVEVDLSFRDTVRFGFIGNVFNLVIPGAISGDFVKGGFVYKRVPPDHRGQGIASMAIDRIVGVLGLFLLAALVGLIFWARGTAETHRLTVIAVAASLAGILGLCVLFTPSLYRPLVRRLHSQTKVAKILRTLVGMATAYRAKIAVIPLTVAMSMVNHGLNVLAFYLIGQALFDQVPSLTDHYVIVPLVLFTTAAPLPFGALGLSEQVSGRLFDLVDHPGGAVAMMGFRVIMYAGAVLSMFVYLANIQEVREAERAAELELSADG